jgi:hypothetical protein
VRWLAIILLLCVLPRITLAVQGANIVCFSADHVQIGCHTAIADSCCSTDDEPVEAPDSPEACMDLSSAPVAFGSRVVTETAPPSLACLTLLPALFADTGGSNARPAVRLADAGPPRFAARSFATRISPRT